MDSPRDVPIDADGTRKCWWCKGAGSHIGHLWQVKGAPWGVKTCKTCKGAKTLTEARFQEVLEEWDSIPTEAEVDELRKGEEWKWK